LRLEAELDSSFAAAWSERDRWRLSVRLRPYAKRSASRGRKRSAKNGSAKKNPSGES